MALRCLFHPNHTALWDIYFWPKIPVKAHAQQNTAPNWGLDLQLAEYIFCRIVLVMDLEIPLNIRAIYYSGRHIQYIASLLRQDKLTCCIRPNRYTILLFANAFISGTTLQQTPKIRYRYFRKLLAYNIHTSQHNGNAAIKSFETSHVTPEQNYLTFRRS